MRTSKIFINTTSQQLLFEEICQWIDSQYLVGKFILEDIKFYEYTHLDGYQAEVIYSTK